MGFNKKHLYVNSHGDRHFFTVLDNYDVIWKFKSPCVRTETNDLGEIICVDPLGGPFLHKNIDFFTLILNKTTEFRVFEYSAIVIDKFTPTEYGYIIHCKKS